MFKPAAPVHQPLRCEYGPNWYRHSSRGMRRTTCSCAVRRQRLRPCVGTSPSTPCWVLRAAALVDPPEFALEMATLPKFPWILACCKGVNDVTPAWLVTPGAWVLKMQLYSLCLCHAYVMVCQLPSHVNRVMAKLQTWVWDAHPRNRCWCTPFPYGGPMSTVTGHPFREWGPPKGALAFPRCHRRWRSMIWCWIWTGVDH